MRIAFFINDLTHDVAHLMPWRTVLEVAAYINKCDKHQVIVLSGSRLKEKSILEIKGVSVCNVPKPDNPADCEEIARICINQNSDVLYYPLDWRFPLKKINNIEKKVNLKIVWYIPGAWYHLSYVFKAIPYLGVKASLPYIYQAIIPRRFFVKKLIITGVRQVITMTDYNKTMLEGCGYPREQIFSIPPGKSPLTINEDSDSSSWAKIKSELAGRPFFLFFGPPQAIRGIWQLLKAFKSFIKKNTEMCLVCLFRSDKNLNSCKIKSKIAHFGLPSGRFFCEWNSVTSSDLHYFIKHSYSVLLPFLLVPSEIPLAVIEAAGYGKPVIGTGPDGTGCFIEQFGLMVPPADSTALADAMQELYLNKKSYHSKCQCAKKVYDSHPDWNSVAQQWLKVAQVTN